QREAEIETGAPRGGRELATDVTTSAGRLEEVWSRCSAAGWPNRHLLADNRWPITASPWRRLREVEVHHVDLGLGYQATGWPDQYLRWELPQVLEQLPQRMRGPDDPSRLLLWLIGRTDQPPRIDLEPW